MVIRMSNATIHKFEQAGLGVAPFRVAGYEKSTFQAVAGDPNCPILPGSTCDYCGMSIMHVFHIQSADGRRFKVGCDCVEKTGDAGLARVVKKQADAIKRDARIASESRRIESAKAALLADESLRARLKARAHPMRWALDKGLTGLDYCEWTFANAGHSGQFALAKWLERFVAGEAD